MYILTGTFLLVLSHQNCGKQIQDTNSGNTNLSIDCTTQDCEESKSCILDDKEILNGDSFLAFQNSEDTACISETRTCNSGVLSGTYTHLSCEDVVGTKVGQPCSFNNVLLQDGKHVLAYLNSSAASSSQCVSEIRTCNDGVLSGSYNFASCGVQKKHCLFNGKSLAHGKSVTAYNLVVGGICEKEVRVCNDGSLTGSFNHLTCDNNNRQCTFNGKSLNDGEKIKAFKNDVEKTTCIEQWRTCKDGMLSGTYDFSSCSTIKEKKDCLFNGAQVAHNESVSAFEASTVSFSKNCTKQVRRCDDGVLTGDFAFASCKKEAPAACLANGRTIPSGDRVFTFEKANGTKNQKCEDLQLTNNCIDGKFSPALQHYKCDDFSVEWKIMSINIHHGRDVSDVNNLDRIIKFIQDQNADVIALQEVDMGASRTNNEKQAKYIADKLQFYYFFEKSIDLSGGEYGNAIISRFPIQHLTTLVLPPGSPTKAGKNETRKALSVNIRPDSQDSKYDFVFIATHVGIFETEDVNEKNTSKILTEYIYQKIKEKKNIVVAGDLNSPNINFVELSKVDFTKNVISNLAVLLDTEPNIKRNNYQIDYILFRNTNVYSMKDWKLLTWPQQGTSDHRPRSAVLYSK